MRRAALCLLAMVLPAAAASADDLFELAKKVANPLADLMAAPFLYNWDGRLGSDEDGTSNYVRFQPVVPLHIDPNWNVIARLFMPMVEQSDVSPGSGTQLGLVGTNLSFFLSPRGPVARGITLGLGPVVSFPASDSEVGFGSDGGHRSAGSGAVDHRLPDATHLVGRRQRHRGRHQRDLSAAVRKLHNARCIDVQPQQRGLLLLERQPSLRADQLIARDIIANLHCIASEEGSSPECLERRRTSVAAAEDEALALRRCCAWRPRT